MLRKGGWKMIKSIQWSCEQSLCQALSHLNNQTMTLGGKKTNTLKSSLNRLEWETWMLYIIRTMELHRNTVYEWVAFMKPATCNKLECFWNPLDLSCTSIQYRVNIKHLQGGGRTWKMIGRTFCPSHSCSSFRLVTAWHELHPCG